MSKSHWEHVYDSRDPDTASWFQASPQQSMAMIRATGVPAEAPLIDVGGGASRLVDSLHNSGYTDITVLDVSGSALERSQERLGDAARAIEWIEADVTEFEPGRRYRVWHDRAAFHFLTDAASMQRYLDVLQTALSPSGHFVLATFGPEGPNRCSGLNVQRYSVDALVALLEADFVLHAFEIENHTTPSGTLQQFLFTRWQARA